MAESAIETIVYEFQVPGGWTEEFTPAPRRAPATGEVVKLRGVNEKRPSFAAHEIETMLDELDEARWDASFAKSPEVLERLAAEAEQEDRAGLTDVLDPDLL